MSSKLVFWSALRRLQTARTVVQLLLIGGFWQPVAAEHVSSRCPDVLEFEYGIGVVVLEGEQLELIDAMDVRVASLTDDHAMLHIVEDGLRYQCLYDRNGEVRIVSNDPRLLAR